MSGNFRIVSMTLIFPALMSPKWRAQLGYHHHSFVQVWEGSLETHRSLLQEAIDRVSSMTPQDVTNFRWFQHKADIKSFARDFWSERFGLALDNTIDTSSYRWKYRPDQAQDPLRGLLAVVISVVIPTRIEQATHSALKWRYPPS